MASEQLVGDPVRRQTLRFARAADRLLAEVWVDPGGDVPRHLHPRQEERFLIRSGHTRFTIGSRELLPVPGERLTVHAGVWHSFLNIGSEVAELEIEVIPALDLQGFLEKAAALARAGRYTRRGVPTSLVGLLQLSLLADEYKDVTVLATPPLWLQRLLLAPLARLARRLSVAV